MGKPRLKQIQTAVSAAQQEILDQEAAFSKKNKLAGWCQVNDRLATELGGDTYDTFTQSQHGPVHTVGVISPKGSNRGIIVDITQEKGIVGEVSDVRNPQGVVENLKQRFGIGGWGRRK
jgi:hypothetical protein